MMTQLKFILAISCIVSFSVYANPQPPIEKNPVTEILSNHFKAYTEKEYFSGIALSVYIPNQPIKDFYIGKISHQENSKDIDKTTLFEIGSITKSFTAAIILQLEKEKKLSLEDNFRQWLPEYERWPQLNLKSLLNMTSGLPNYTDAPLMNSAVYENPHRAWSDQELLQFVYPTSQAIPPLKSGYFYSNTNYILAGMIIEKLTKNSLQDNMQKRLINPARLENTFYPFPVVDHQVITRLAQGYAFNPYMNPELVGKEMGLSTWTKAAGGIVSNSTDVIKWVKALFVDDTILDANQKSKLQQLVSTQTGNPISVTSQTDPHAFALGVTQTFNKDIGIYWMYEGETEGFRALYMYVPKTGIIIASIFNSAVNSENDHAGELMQKVYDAVKNLK